MSHPVIEQVLPLIRPVAHGLGLEIVNVTFQTNHSPPVLRVDVRNLREETGLNDCEQMSRAVEEILDQAEIFPDAYVLEISSPGLSDFLSTDRDFVTFKGFPVLVRTRDPYKKQREWAGLLIEKAGEGVKLNLKGRIVIIPIDLIESVQLHNPA
ncbi:ribosome maturation factor RimP [Lyngbya confervoides]|uniref:Ribosome maturation factor RimP n=1 Tax=Lyngbya confervoides BDU141951 TaxID=1574623 RepID=A0ABD4T2J7_9CYAN|nr:ribosome maturation factor RimP [Lyngbya confervoides]MCM1982718.1 ribosome maturation factor RimP [Lyngbya confervoides BDU141951]